MRSFQFAQHACLLSHDPRQPIKEAVEISTVSCDPDTTRFNMHNCQPDRVTNA